MAKIRGDQAMAWTVAAMTRKISDRFQKASRTGPNENSPMDRKKKKIADQ